MGTSRKKAIAVLAALSAVFAVGHAADEGGEELPFGEVMSGVKELLAEWPADAESQDPDGKVDIRFADGSSVSRARAGSAGKKGEAASPDLWVWSYHKWESKVVQKTGRLEMRTYAWVTTSSDADSPRVEVDALEASADLDVCGGVTTTRHENTEYFGFAKTARSSGPGPGGCKIPPKDICSRSCATEGGVQWCTDWACSR